MSSSTVASPSSSPPTPPSLLPVSVGPGLQSYVFTPSPSPSPPFSPSETSPLLRVVRSEPRLRSSFSVDTFAGEPSCPPTPRRRFDLGACLEWMLTLVCCCCCSSKTSKFEN